MMADVRFIPSQSWRSSSDGGAGHSKFSNPVLLNTAPKLPIPASSFVGRAADVAEVRVLVAEQAVVTLVGAGGCGKTRLALAVGQEVLADGAAPDGVWFADLAPLADPDLVAPVVAKLLGLPQSTGDVLDELVEHLTRARLLLILDNCEHVIDAAAELADRIVSRCASIRVLATSRERLAVPAESVVKVRRLDTPPRNAASLDAVMTSASAQLFVDRARRADAELVVAESDARPLAQICEGLDGMPLALELAAARASVLSIAEIAAGLDDHFTLAGRGWRTAQPRHQTLRATVGWSYDLLDDAERIVLNRCSVFAGGFTAEAAAAVCSGGAVGAAAVPELLSRLVDKSLAVVERGGSSTRCRLLETIRQYAAEHLAEADDAAAARDRHVAWFAEVAGGLQDAALSAEGGQALDECERDHDNFRAALTWCASTPAQAENALRIARDVFIFWSWRGYAREGLHWMELALEGAPVSALAASVARRSSVLAYTLGDVDLSVSLCERAIETARATDRGELGRALMVLGGVWMNRGAMATAGPMLTEALAIALEDQEDWSRANCLTQLAWMAQRQGRYDESRRLAGELEAIAPENNWDRARALEVRAMCDYEQGRYDAAAGALESMLAVGVEMGDPEFQASALEGLGAVAAAQGLVGEAAGAYDRAVELTRDKPDVMLMATWGGLGELAAAEGRFGDARLFLDRGVEVARRRDDAYMLAWSLTRFGDAGLAAGELDAAEGAYAEAHEIASRCGLPWPRTAALDGLAALAAAHGRLDEAVRLGDEADAVRTVHAIRRPWRALRAASPAEL